MNRILNTTEIIGTVELSQGEFEVCASADASYDLSVNSLVVQLAAELRPCSAGKPSPSVKPEWLPKSQTVTEHVSITEASEVAREIFHSWVRKVREAAPRLHAPSF